MTWHGPDIIMATAFTALLVNCGAFLAFGWRFPGIFRGPGARRRAWIGVCLGIALDIVTLINVIAPEDNDFSGAKGDWITVFLVLSCTLVLTAIMLVVLLARASARARRQ